MPELPEVETIVRDLRKSLLNSKIRQVELFRKPVVQNISSSRFIHSLTGRIFKNIERRGKYLVFDLDNHFQLIVHLRMTGKFILGRFRPSDFKYKRAVFYLNLPQLLIFDDVRAFGTFSLFKLNGSSSPLSHLGLEPFSSNFNTTTLVALFKKSGLPVKNFLLDQTKIAGLGNIYVSEILFDAGINPKKRSHLLTSLQIGRFILSTRKILEKAIRYNGTSISDYQRIDRKAGQFQKLLRVYQRGGEPCVQCRTPIRRIVQGQRSTFYCPVCQE